ncbi:hypothetical protein TrCOL_g8124 [Triparma columacea]|uniref:Uncharacterized protein n=1 Tax=Triparma columacea TaxID=722753 RepID=A0A9W7FVX8_9STRA|nr:hypothetical protein TrCOL_g8124 [Triparma columacea]
MCLYEFLPTCIKKVQFAILLDSPHIIPELRTLSDINHELNFVSTLTKQEKEILTSKYEHALASAEQRLALLDNSIVAKPPGGWGLTPRARLKYITKKYGATWYVYFWATWVAHGTIIWTGIKSGFIDAPYMLAIGSDLLTTFGDNLGAGWGTVDLESRVDPGMGEMGVTVVLNEMFEPVRSAFVVATVKPISRMVGMSPKYDFMDSSDVK